MSPFRPTRRQFIGVIGGGAGILGLLGCVRHKQTMVTLYTFGDSILDCMRYNEFGVHPGQLLVSNNDRLFPEFSGQDLKSRGPARLEHRARDGATVIDLQAQARRIHIEGKAIALITIGGNDLLGGLVRDTGKGIATFANLLDEFVRELPIRPVLLGNVYDPTFGDDKRNFLGVDPAIARTNLQRVNAAIEKIANHYGHLVDLHAHFLTGDPSWFTATIEPSLRGAPLGTACFPPLCLGLIKTVEKEIFLYRNPDDGWAELFSCFQ